MRTDLDIGAEKGMFKNSPFFYFVMIISLCFRPSVSGAFVTTVSTLFIEHSVKGYVFPNFELSINKQVFLEFSIIVPITSSSVDEVVSLPLSDSPLTEKKHKICIYVSYHFSGILPNV